MTKPLFGPALAVVAAGAFGLLTAAAPGVWTGLTRRWIFWALVVVQLVLPLVIRLLIQSAARSPLEPNCIRGNDTLALASLLLWAACATGGVALVTGLASRDSLQRAVLWVLALAVPYGIMFGLLPEWFCGWN